MTEHESTNIYGDKLMVPDSMVKPDRITNNGFDSRTYVPNPNPNFKPSTFDYLTESARTASGHFHGQLVALSEIEEAFREFIAANAKMDRIKKLLFYGEDVAKGRVRSTVALTADGHTADGVIPAVFYSTLKTDTTEGSHARACEDSEHLLHATLGTATEAGEMVEHLYDVIFKGKPLDLINMREEVFDGQWYHAMFCRVAGITFDEGQRENIAKLRKRFPDKFTTEAANVRDLDAERQVLEGHTVVGNPFGTGLSEPKLVAEIPSPAERIEMDVAAIAEQHDEYQDRLFACLAAKKDQSYEEMVKDVASQFMRVGTATENIPTGAAVELNPATGEVRMLRILISEEEVTRQLNEQGFGAPLAGGITVDDRGIVTGIRIDGPLSGVRQAD